VFNARCRRPFAGADAFFISLFSFLYYLLSIFNKKFSFTFASLLRNYPPAAGAAVAVALRMPMRAAAAVERGRRRDLESEQRVAPPLFA
jgi:hypothetical protein